MSTIDETEEKSPISNWEWHPCIYDIQQSFTDREQFWNLSPYFMFSETNEDVNCFNLII